jgi:hypothetical protein
VIQRWIAERARAKRACNRCRFSLILCVALALSGGIAWALMNQILASHVLRGQEDHQIPKSAAFRTSIRVPSIKTMVIPDTSDAPDADDGAPTDAEKNTCNSHGKVGLLIWHARTRGLSERRALGTVSTYLEQDPVESSQAERTVKEVYEGSAANLDAEGTTELLYEQCLTQLITSRIGDVKKHPYVATK